MSSPPTMFVFGTIHNNNDDDDETDDEMPPLEEARPTIRTTSLFSSASTPPAPVVTPSSSSSSTATPRNDATSSSTTTPVVVHHRNSHTAPSSDNVFPPLSTTSARRIVHAIRPPTSVPATSGGGCAAAPDFSTAAAMEAMIAIHNTTNNHAAATPSDENDATDNDENDDDNSEEDDDSDEDEDYEEHSHSSSEDDDEDDDDDDEEEDSSDEESGVPPEFYDLFRFIQTQHDHDDDGDHDDDNDSGPCTCHHCLLEHFGLDDDDEEEEEENDDKVDSNDQDNNNTASTSPPPTLLNPHGSPCAVCMESETTHRHFVALPCCGDACHQKESTLSTRFCHACLVKYLAKSGIPLPPISTASAEKNVNGHTPMEELQELEVVGECPRCKHLLVLGAHILGGGSHDDSHKKKNVEHLIFKAQIRHMLWYIGGKDSGNYRPHLLTLAWVNPHYIPTELLLNDSNSEDKIAHLCQWGVLQKQGTIVVRSNNNSYKASLQQTQQRLRSLAVTQWGRMRQPLKDFLRTKIGMDTAWTNSNNNNNNDSSSLPQASSFDSFASQSSYSARRRSAMEAIHNLNAKEQAETVYGMSPILQRELISLMLAFVEIDSDNDMVMRTCRKLEGDDKQQNARKHCLMVALNCGASGWMALTQGRCVRALRLWNRGLTLGLLALPCKILPVWVVVGEEEEEPSLAPSSDDRHDEYCWKAATGLNIFLLYVTGCIGLQLVWVVYYLLLGFGVAKLVGSYFVPQPLLWKRHMRTAVVMWYVYQAYLYYQSLFPEMAIVAADDPTVAKATEEVVLLVEDDPLFRKMASFFGVEADDAWEAAHSVGQEL